MKNLTLFNSLNRHPSRFFTDFDRDLERLFDLYSPSRFDTDQQSVFDESFSPSLDMLDKDSHYLMSLDIPGVKKGDIKIEVNDGVLSIEGERKFERKEGDYLERRSGHFKRMVKLPEGVEEDSVQAHFEDGVLSIAVPKAEKSRPKEISIQDGKRNGVWSRLLGLGQTSKEHEQEGEAINTSKAS